MKKTNKSFLIISEVCLFITIWIFLAINHFGSTESSIGDSMFRYFWTSLFYFIPSSIALFFGYKNYKNKNWKILWKLPLKIFLLTALVLFILLCLFFFIDFFLPSSMISGEGIFFLSIYILVFLALIIIISFIISLLTYLISPKIITRVLITISAFLIPIAILMNSKTICLSTDYRCYALHAVNKQDASVCEKTKYPHFDQCFKEIARIENGNISICEKNDYNPRTNSFCYWAFIKIYNLKDHQICKKLNNGLYADSCCSSAFDTAVLDLSSEQKIKCGLD